MTAFESSQLRQVLGCFATGVTVVTTGGEHPRGMTVNSFASVSLNPPLILYSSTPGQTLEGVKASRHFAVNILAHSQLELARRFAGQTQIAEHDRFDGVDWRPGASGSPLLGGALGILECRVWQIVPAGDHDILIGEVLELHRSSDAAAPLLFYRGSFPELAS